MHFYDCHCHLGGYIPPSFVWETISKAGRYDIAPSLEAVQRHMTFSDQEPRSFYGFLEKFRILDRIEWTEDLIDGSIKSVCDEIKKHNIRYSWMRFSVNKYLERIKWDSVKAIRFIEEAFRRHAPGKVGLILALKYESDRDNQRALAKLIEQSAIQDVVIGIDLVGDEAFFDAGFYRDIFQAWKRNNKLLCAHVGESQSAENVREAINFGVQRIAHGIKIIDQPDILQLAMDKYVGFDMALSSNYLTGVWTHSTEHPVSYFLRKGLDVTIGTDDPVQCSTTLAREYALASSLGLSDEEIVQLQKNALKAVTRSW